MFFRGGGLASGVHTERRWASQTLSRPEKRQGQASVQKRGGGGGGLNPPSSLTNPNQRLQLPLQGGEQGGGRAAKWKEMERSRPVALEPTTITAPSLDGFIHAVIRRRIRTSTSVWMTSESTFPRLCWNQSLPRLGGFWELFLFFL